MTVSERPLSAWSALQMFTVRRQTLGADEPAGAGGPRPSRILVAGWQHRPNHAGLSSVTSRLLAVAWGTAAAALPGCGR